jgi:hypothetical protein
MGACGSEANAARGACRHGKDEGEASAQQRGEVRKEKETFYLATTCGTGLRSARSGALLKPPWPTPTKSPTKNRLGNQCFGVRKEQERNREKNARENNERENTADQRIRTSAFGVRENNEGEHQRMNDWSAAHLPAVTRERTH